jgi:hypothetical protein
MKEITKLMIKEYKLNKLKYDFMGYYFDRPSQLSAHHLVVPARDGGKLVHDNVAILRQDTSHDYLHVIENYDHDCFKAITKRLIDENLIGSLSKNELLAIRDILLYFENEYWNKRTKTGKYIIKEEYMTKRVPMNRL